MKACRNRVRRHGHNKSWFMKQRASYWDIWVEKQMERFEYERIMTAILEPSLFDSLFKACKKNPRLPYCVEVRIDG